MIDKVVSIVLYEAVNFAWVDSDAIYVPHGRGFKGEDGEIITGFSKDKCDKIKNRDESKAASFHCEASEGMAGLFSAAGRAV